MARRSLRSVVDGTSFGPILNIRCLKPIVWLEKWDGEFGHSATGQAQILVATAWGYNKKPAIYYALKKRSHMAIVQMNWGRMLFPLDHPRMADFSESLDGIYWLADKHQGFIWRIRDDDAAMQLQALCFDNRLSATVSVWET